jgi:hypothetical protein|tara:strand:+ start:972 stop:2180 length:1209 start_codon:yes stop_codon:yes gene_type:complete
MNISEMRFMKLIPYMLSILLALLIFNFSLNPDMWAKILEALNIPPNNMPFSDYKAHLSFLKCQELGIDINSQECILIPDGNGKINSHPRIWIYLFSVLNLKNALIYNVSIVTLFSLYFLVLLNIFKTYKNNLSKFAFLVFFFSTSNFILIERLATDLIIFLIVFLIINTKNKIFQSLLISLGFVLKYYPIFLISLLTEKKKYVFIFFTFMAAFISLFYIKEIQLVNKNIVEMALPIAYGSRTMLKAFYHLSLEYNFFLNDKNMNFFRNLTVLTFFIYVFFLIIIGYNNKYLINTKYKLDKYFLAGASIYVGTFIIGANADYRLIFLIFTIQYVINLESKLIRNLLIFSYFFSLNSFYFLNGDVLSITFFINSSFIFLCKFIILSLLAILLGTEMKKINFFRF